MVINVPSDTSIARWKQARDDLLDEARCLPFWQWRQKLILKGAAAAYGVEIEDLQELIERTEASLAENEGSSADNQESV